ncbi:MAG TPA: TIGR01777 family oxidoreductase [Candidatus Hydrogenedentes bacterium]|nr:TIGR01777 family oxidoreductase [Candidatus Hydrogenedentota bacterium]
MKVLMSGSTGLIGSALVKALAAHGDTVARLVRPPAAGFAPELVWDPAAGRLNPACFEGADAVIHLSGENIASGRWTRARMERLRGSRVDSTRLLSETVAGLGHPPGVFVCASAVGFYGHRGDEVLDETSAAGIGFLPEVCEAWEGATNAAKDAGVRVVNLRFGGVFASEGGLLGKMLPLFRWGLGGIVGNGAQYMSWVTLEDAVSAALHAMSGESIEGPVNVVAPEPVTNRTFTKALGRALRRPTAFRVPAAAVRVAFGPMADEVLLASQRVVPGRLTESGFSFSAPDVDRAFRAMFGN